MVVMLEWKKSMSPERMSRSELGMWPFSCAVTSSMTAWSSDGSSAVRDGRSERVLMRIWLVMRF